MEAYLQTEDLAVGYQGRTLIGEISLAVQRGRIVTLIGPNGSGKSTILKTIIGQLPSISGSVFLDGADMRSRSRGDVARRMAILMTARMDPELMTCRDVVSTGRYPYTGHLGVLRPEDKAIVEQSLRETDALAFADRPFQAVSDGQRQRILLARALCQQPELIVLDEPTNHLDLHAIEWLEQYLSTFKGTVVAISHDRYFLDRTITRVIEVLDGKAEFYSGNYSFYAVEKERRYLEKMRQYEKEQAKIAQLEKSAEQLRMFAFKGMDKTYRRALSMEKRIERMRTTDKPTKERALSAQFKSQEFYGDEVFALKKLKKSFGDRVLFHDVDLQVRGGERIALIGDNGTGKSTLIKMLMEEEYPDEGKIKFGPSVRIAYLPQIVEFDVPERNLVDTMLYSKRNITPQSARNRLAAFHFTGEDVFKSVSVLSGGELSRLKLCILMDEEVNLLILDEPTNHLDIASREWIEEAVESYDGTLLFVSHDRYFINRFATRVWELENGVITDYPMGFARYRQVKALEAQNKIDHTPKAVKEKTVTEKPKPNRSAQQARRQLTICEKEISSQETAIAEIEQRLEEAGGDYERYSEIYKEKEAAEQKLSELMEKWETLAEQAGE